MGTQGICRTLAKAPAVLTMVLAVYMSGAAWSQDGVVMTLSDIGLAPVQTPDVQPVPAGSVLVQPGTGAVNVDPLIYNEDGSLYTGPMPDGSYCVNGRIVSGYTSGVPQGTVIYGDGGVVYDPGAVYDYGDVYGGGVIVESPNAYYGYEVYDPYWERRLDNTFFYPWSNRWDHYRYRPDRRPPHRPNWDRPRPPRPEGPRPPRPEGPRPPRPEGPRPGRPEGVRPGGGRPNRPPPGLGGERPSRPDRPGRAPGGGGGKRRPPQP